MDYTSPVSGKLIFDALRDVDCIVMAANIRVQQSTRGIMQAAMEKEAAVLFEIAKSEIGYTAQRPAEFVAKIKEAAQELNFNQPYCIHGDHITIKENTPEAVKAGEDLIKEELAAGFTSFAIDASHNFNVEAKDVRDQLKDNIEITTKLAKLIPGEYSLEVEVGEIGRVDPETGKQELTTVEEAVAFIKALQENGIKPDLLAINNGTVHGNVYDADGNIVPLLGLDAQRTREIADAIKPLGVKIAQHGITGTPFELMHKVIDAGVAKGNVGTNWQNIVVDNLPDDLRKKMEDWVLGSKHYAKAKEKSPKKSDKEIVSKNIKHAIKEFKTELENIDQEYVDKIAAASKKSALDFFDAFNALGTGSKVKAAIE